MRIKTALLSCLLGLGIHATAWAAGSIRGEVSDALSQQAVAGATLSLSGPSLDSPLSTTTDASGSYRFEALEPGRYSLRASAPGHLPFERGEIPVRDERTSRVNLPLLPENLDQ